MRISFFMILIIGSLVILAATFIRQFPTVLAILSMALILLCFIFSGIFLLRNIGNMKGPHKYVCASVFAMLTLLTIVGWISSALIIHISIWLIVALLLLITFYFIIHIRRQETQIQSISNEMEDFNESFLHVSAQRHDYMKHIHVLDYLLEKDGSTEASHYMEQLLPRYKQVNKSIKGEQGHIASILLKLQKNALEQDITLNIQLDQPLSHMPLQTYEQVELIGNLIENAMEAAQETEEKRVSLFSSHVSGIFKIEVVNTTNPLPDEVANHLFDRILPSKKGREHGIGTTIIKNLVQKYEGMIDYTYNGKQVHIRIAFPLIDNLYSE